MKKDLQWEPYFRPLREKLETRDNLDINAIEDAFYFAAHAHREQTRKSGEPYIIHPVAVAEILDEIDADTETIIAALLHDVVEDTNVSLLDLESNFGNNIASLVDSVTKATELSVFGDKNEAKLQSLKKIFSGSVLNSRAIIIKLADRVHNIQSISLFRKEKQQRIAEETLDIYYPLAKIFGIWKYKRILEKFCIPALNPENFILHQQAIKDFKKKNDDFIPKLEQKFSNLFLGIPNTTSSILVDTGTFFPKESQSKEISHHINVVINVSCLDDVYVALGRIHKEYPFQNKEFKDYISLPKSNGYRSIHTNIHCFSEIIHFRIQTESMFEKNNKGCFFLTPENFPQKEINTSLQALDKNYYASDQYLSDLKKDILERKIFIFTDDGRAIFLPKNSIGVDFAYAVGEKKGHRLLSVLVNGEKYSPTKTLYNEDSVSLILAEEENPKPYWIGLSKSNYTKQCIIEWGEKLSEDIQFQRGKESLKKEFSRLSGINYNENIIKNIETELLHVFPEESYKKILQKVGIGSISSSVFIKSYIVILNSKKLESFFYRAFLIIKTFFFQSFYFFFTSNIQSKNAFVVLLKIRAKDRKKMLYDILGAIGEMEINIAGLKIFSLRPSLDAYYKVEVEVFSNGQLQKLIKSIEELSDIKDIDSK